MGIRKVPDVRCDLDTSFRFNGLFEASNKAAKAYTTTGQFNGRIFKSIHRREDTGYRTYFGPWFSHSGITYARTAHNTSHAITRLFHEKVRLRDIIAHQKRAIRNGALVKYRRKIGDLSAALLSERRGDWSELCGLEANAPHPKRSLRAPAWLEIRAESADSSEGVTFLKTHKHIQVNIKPDEFAKYNSRTREGKAPRAVNDLGVAASLRAPWLVNAIKEVLSKTPLPTRWGSYICVAKSHVDTVSSLFQRMETSNLFVYHSDDSTVSFVTSEGPFWANLDISSCDASNTQFVFWALLEFAPGIFSNHMLALIDQCAHTCRVGYGKGNLVFKPKKFFEYSGSLLTTLLNNIASLAIGFHITNGYTKRSKAATEQFVKDRLETCGWKCTLQVCSKIEQVQFLKMSPCRAVDGSIVAILNLGVILRCLGQRRGDLPGKGCLVQRARAFNAGLVRGMVHAGNHSFLRTLQTKFLAHRQREDTVYYNSSAVEGMVRSENQVLDDSSVRARYDISSCAYEELCSLVMAADVGDSILCDATRKIMDLDYGL